MRKFREQFVGCLIEADRAPPRRGELAPDANEAMVLGNGANALPKDAEESVSLPEIF